MNSINLRYRKNFGLLIAFFVLVTILFVASTFFARTMTTNFVEAEFNNKKVEVFDESIKPFNTFFTEKIPEISYFQGYMSDDQASDFSNTVLRSFPFVNEVRFFDVVLTNRDSVGNGVRFNNLTVYSKVSYLYKLDKDNRLLGGEQSFKEYLNATSEFNNMMLKFVGFIEGAKDSTRLTDNDIFKVFYALQPGMVSYLNIPRMSDIMNYQTMMNDVDLPESSYEQDLFVFSIDPTKIHIQNKYPNLYEEISIKAVVDQYVTNDESYLRTELPLPGALSDYKLQFDTSREFIVKDINKRFFPVMVGISLVYLFLILTGYLIYRNAAINSRLYQLQYDFINNLTHEFKTPVSVIKIAGNNIKSADNISEVERQMYGRILDQEADKLNNLMNKLLSFAQIENKSIKFHGEDIDLKVFLSQFFDSIQLKYPDLKLDFKIDVKSMLYTDPVLLTSVCQNLVDNAYKYSPIDRKFLAVTVEQNKKYFTIFFKDKGIGIDKREFNSIFKKFYRVKNQFNQQGSIGLGLAFCKEITEFMGGDIKVDSQLNVGTTFTLIFPVDVKKI
ncbi:sensor histidine kinase [Sphingobacterium rhinopitheci]|uniref:sensor histidine kinase n=1 Tax=Sphingobacterium rhinopitheci TaxID=2781960 RepID=UPI001F526D6E|nr:HAMP domain-containing sensor histidine kinase [Sphingobacterium rhinopitheci]MCI0920238.1 HAMP domain-containing histidine kinase [Sphingobacterium rhinopitheci]